MSRPFLEKPKSKNSSVRMTEEDFQILLKTFGSVQIAIDFLIELIKKEELGLFGEVNKKHIKHK